MKISSAERSLIAYQIQQDRLQDRRDVDFRKVQEQKRFDQLVAERVSRNIRMGRDKGQNVDVEC